VIARLVTERDAARAGMAQAGGNGGGAYAGNGESKEAMDVEDGAGGGGGAGGIPADAMKQMKAVAKKLSKGRKKRATPEGLASVEDIQGMAVTSSATPHQASKPGILCAKMSTTDDALVATGGVDGNALLFNRESGQVVGRMKGHSKKVLDLDFAGDTVLTGSADKTARLWQSKGEGKYEVAHKLSLHTDEVTGVTVHAGTGTQGQARRAGHAEHTER
jgi:pre-mRNA-processing factor 19